MKKLFLSVLSFICILFVSAQEFTTSKGYKGSVEIGFAAGAGDAGHNRGEFLLVNGYRFTPWLSAGIGTGIQVWQVTRQVTLPLFADFEATFMQKTISPYADLRLGYCWGLSHSAGFRPGHGWAGMLLDDILPKDGIYFSPTIGFRWGMNRNTALKLGVGYLMQGSQILQNPFSPNAFTETIYFHSLIAKVAFEF